MSENRVVDANMLARAAGINSNNLQGEFVDLPGQMAYWTQQYANAYEDFLVKKAAFEVAEARLSSEARTQLELNGKKATEATIMENTRSNPEWLKARTDLIRAEGNKIRIHGIVNTVESKREMLVSIGAHIRAEMNAFPSVGAAAGQRAHERHASQTQHPVGNSVQDWVQELRDQANGR